VPVPVSLPSGTVVTGIATSGWSIDSDQDTDHGFDSSLAVTSTGALLAWGDNTHGEIGDGTTTPSPLPVQVNVPSGASVKQAVLSSTAALALTVTGSLLAWGDDEEGEAGNGTEREAGCGCVSSPGTTSLPSGTNVLAVAMGDFFGVALVQSAATPAVTRTIGPATETPNQRGTPAVLTRVVVDAPKPHPNEDSLNAIDCTSAANCWAMAAPRATTTVPLQATCWPLVQWNMISPTFMG